MSKHASTKGSSLPSRTISTGPPKLGTSSRIVKTAPFRPPVKRSAPKPETFPVPITDRLAGHPTLKLAKGSDWTDIYNIPPPTKIKVKRPEVIVAKYELIPVMDDEDWDWDIALARHGNKGYTIDQYKRRLERYNFPQPVKKTKAAYIEYFRENKKSLL